MADVSSTLTQHELEEPFRLTNPAGEVGMVKVNTLMMEQE